MVNTKLNGLLKDNDKCKFNSIKNVETSFNAQLMFDDFSKCTVLKYGVI